ncbi:MAG: enoyl-CoA hydratase/isomerase family protein [Actinomycetes bacterium]
MTADIRLPGGVRLGMSDGVAVVTLDRPPRNAQVPSTWTSLASLPNRLSDDVRVVVLRAEGPAFSAGLDLSLLQPDGVDGEVSAAELAADPSLDATIASFQDGFSWWAEHPAVSIAVVSGPAVGAGFQLALAADLRVIDTTASFAMRETTLGLVPDLGGTQRLARLVGPSRALELVATGRRLEAVEAHAVGLANVLASPADLGAEVDRLVASLLAVPSAALRAAKQLMTGALDRSTREQLDAERSAQVPLLRAMVSRSPSA